MENFLEEKKDIEGGGAFISRAKALRVLHCRVLHCSVLHHKS